ncbi:N-acetylmuramoyl-L-alanine amidase [Nannocystis bainbridge]|uniref:N-acetylmuramoyl-L-alanine amidase n=1 Tax=Nannocystis bainbridge TaxID=2995303 RepID=A0ABT5E612_9BACT|nr:peptidoglycan recognition family protein [Nannocystis bainbridge]MDC0720242.1 peptidoglycan recognition family protein [Nannocystis bainbridge]
MTGVSTDWKRRAALWIGASVLGLSAGTAAAHPLADAPPEPEREDDHWRPAELESWAIEPPPPLGADPEYPLAAAFDPACACNHSAGGITSYQHVVVHTMQGSYAGTKSWFKNPQAQVSCHYIMRSVDGEVTQMVLDKDKAWHVGSSNATSIGIEHEGYVDDPAKWYTWETYVSSARLTRWLTTRHDIPVDRDHIVGHVELPNQSHTDPGGGWNWDMYMGLVHDVVPQGQIHVAVVDRSKLCTITATTNTYLQRTAESIDLLTAPELCPIAAGAKVTYLHASAPIGARRRLLMEAGQGPCAGVNGLDAVAFVDPNHFTAMCAPAAMAAVGATVSLDGGPGQAVDANGLVALPPVGAGAHAVDVAGPGLYEPAAEIVDLAVYPGVRVAIAVDPVAVDPPDPPDPTGGGETGGNGETGGAGETGAGETGGEVGGEVGETGLPDPSGAPTTGSEGGEPTTGDDGGEAEAGGDEAGPPVLSGAALPEGYGQDGEDGCACRSSAGGREGWLASVLVLVGIRRRRRR